VLAVALAATLAACASPEATRQRAGGRGADVGNVGPVVRMHEGSDPYWRTPTVRDVRPMPLDSARQADRLSR
jgi:hypothetical protein